MQQGDTFRFKADGSSDGVIPPAEKFRIVKVVELGYKNEDEIVYYDKNGVYVVERINDPS